MERAQLPERLLPTESRLSPQQELKALDKEKQDHKWEIMRGEYAWPPAKEYRRQALMKEVAGPVIVPGPVPMCRMDRDVKTGFEESPFVRGYKKEGKQQC